MTSCDIYVPNGVLQARQLPIVVLLQYLTFQFLSLAKGTRISSTISSFAAAMPAHILCDRVMKTTLWNLNSGLSYKKTSSNIIKLVKHVC